jgi:hypothetical protein
MKKNGLLANLVLPSREVDHKLARAELGIAIVVAMHRQERG